jgi:glycosyltransferase involved in cell wall biosynthesis
VVWYCNEPRRETYYDVLEPGQLDEWNVRVLRKYRFKSLGKLRLVWNNNLYKLLDKVAIKRIRLVLANSNYAAGMIKKALNISPTVCHAGVRLNLHDPPRTETGSYGLLVSRMVFHKNVDMVLKAFAEARNCLSNDVRLVLAGKGPDLEALRKLSIDIGLSEVVDFKGYVSDEQLESLYAHADFFIYIPLHEPFGLTLIEAMKYGVPVIGASDGGASEIIESGKEGFLIDPLDKESVVLCLRKMLTEKTERSKMGLAARSRVLDYYTLDAFVERFENCVGKVLK